MPGDPPDTTVAVRFARGATAPSNRSKMVWRNIFPQPAIVSVVLLAAAGTALAGTLRGTVGI